MQTHLNLDVECANARAEFDANHRNQLGESGRSAFVAGYVAARLSATPAGVTAPEVVRELREYASNPDYSHQDYADTMRQAAEALAASEPVVPQEVVTAALHKATITPLVAATSPAVGQDDSGPVVDTLDPAMSARGTAGVSDQAGSIDTPEFQQLIDEVAFQSGDDENASENHKASRAALIAHIEAITGDAWSSGYAEAIDEQRRLYWLSAQGRSEMPDIEAERAQHNGSNGSTALGPRYGIGDWKDTSEDAYQLTSEKNRRILYTAPQPATVMAQPLGWAWERRYSNGGYTREFKVSQSDAIAMTEHFGAHSGTNDVVYPFFSKPPATVKAGVTDEQISEIIENADGVRCVDGEYSIEGRDLMNLARALLAQQGAQAGMVDRDAVLEEAALAVEALYNDSAYQHGNRSVSRRVAGEQSAYEAAEDAIRALKGKPDATAPAGEVRHWHRLLKAASTYAERYVQDEAEDPEVCNIKGQHEDAKELFASIKSAVLHQEKRQKGGA